MRYLYRMNKRILLLSCMAVVGSGLFATAFGQSNPGAPAPSAAGAQPIPVQAVPILDGGVGPCSVEFTVINPDGKPAAAAIVKVHIAYGFGGFHKLDLQLGANSDGKLKFTGIPSRVRRSELEFEASKGDLVGTATLNPATECKAKREIRLGKPNASAGGGR